MFPVAQDRSEQRATLRRRLRLLGLLSVWLLGACQGVYFPECMTDCNAAPSSVRDTDLGGPV